MPHLESCISSLPPQQQQCAVTSYLGCKPGESPPGFQSLKGRLQWVGCGPSVTALPEVSQVFWNTIPAPSQTYVAANPSSEMSRWKINWVSNVTVPYTGVPGLLFTLIPAADWFVTANTGRTDKRQTVQFSCQSWSFTWQTFFFLPACLGHVRAARAGAAVMGQAGTLSGRAKALAPVPRQGCFR